MRLWDAATGQERVRCAGHQGLVWSVALSPDGRRALSGGFDKTMRLWDLDSGQELARFTGHTGVVRRVAFAPDGRSALSCGTDDKEIRLWDLSAIPGPWWAGKDSWGCSWRRPRTCPSRPWRCLRY